MKLYKLPDHLKPKGKALLEMHLEVDHSLIPVEIDLDYVNNNIHRLSNNWKNSTDVENAYNLGISVTLDKISEILQNQK